MKNIKSRNFKRSPIALAVALTLTVPMSINQVQAGAGWGDNANMVSKVPTYYANSPSGLHAATSCFTAAGAPTVPVVGGACDSGAALRKFVNNLPLPEVSGKQVIARTPQAGGVDLPLVNLDLTTLGVNNIGAGGYIPIAKADKWVNAQGLATTDDYFEIAAIEYAERKHSDLPVAGTRLRMYVQLETLANAASSRHIALKYPDGLTPITDALRITGTNPTGQVYAYDYPHSLGPIINATRGVATRIKFTNYLPYTPASGIPMKGAKHFLPVDTTMQSAGVGPDGVTTYTENRIAVHLHGGDGPWISAGSAHQWFAPAGETAAYAAGMGRGQSAINVPDMPDPGPGSYTLYYPNNQNGRFMWYHDQASGITRLNVYAGLAAAYKLSDSTEASLLSSGVLPATLTGGVTVADEIPVVIQDVSFVPKDVAIQDANWNVDVLTNAPVPAGQQPWGQYGDLWFPHVYEINQDPNSPTGWTPVGRWDWGPWFWPVFPAQFSVPSGLVNDVTWVPNAYMDTMMVNGAVYPTLTVEPKPYRMRFMNISNDRFINLGFYLADVSSPAALAAANPLTGTGVLGTEVTMVPFTTGLKRADGSAIVFPATWGQVTSIMSHPAGVPDPLTTGPDIVQIGNEGGFLPQAIVTPSTITNFEWNRRSVTVSNILERGVLLGGGEVADTIVDFTGFAGKTLILYNDAPNMVPAGEPRVDYYTADPDQTGQGGAETTKPGYGPNTRTVMRVVVSAAMKTGTTSNWPAGGTGLTNLIAKLPAAYAASGQLPPVVTAIAYNQAFGTTNIDNYLKIGSGSSMQPDLILAAPGNVNITSLTLADGGGFYTSMPQVVFTPPGGASGSGAVATVGASLGGVTLNTVGAGYTAEPNVVFGGGAYPDTRAVPLPNPLNIPVLTGVTVPSTVVAGVTTWNAQTPAELTMFGPLPTARALVAPAVFATPGRNNIGKATIAFPGMKLLIPPVAPLTMPTISLPKIVAAGTALAPIYQTPPPAPVTITFPTATTYTVTGAVTGNVANQPFVTGGLIRVNGYDVAITNGVGALTPVAPIAGDVFTITANPNAGKITDIVFDTLSTATVAQYIPGPFATPPNVTLVGGQAVGNPVTPTPATAKAVSSGRLNWIGLNNAGTNYSAIPLVDFVGGGGIGATAQVHLLNPLVYPIRNKGIQELYEFTYGRLNGGFSIELPFTTVAIQTTVPVAYIDPVTENLADGETQIWKITHNGLFTHPVYFNHLNVQLINRVGWDGTIKAPYPDELGWKDTVRCNQLEDVYVAVRAKAQPVAGFGVPESIRNWDPSQPVGGVGSGMGLTGADLAGSPIATDPNFNANFGNVAVAPANQSTPCSTTLSDYLMPVAPALGTGAAKFGCLDNEFTWTNGMLGWAELDFMRPVAYHPFVMDTTIITPASAAGVLPVVAQVNGPNYGKWVKASDHAVLAAPLAPTLLSVTSGATGNTLTWADNSTTEYQFTILRSTAALGPFTALATPALANATTYVDTTAVTGTAYWYQVQAVGAKMDGLSTSAAVAVTAAVPLPATPTITSVSQVANSGGTTLVLHWAAITGASLIVYQNGVAVPAANLAYLPLVNPNSVTVSGLAPGVTYQFALQAQIGTALSAISAVVQGTTAAGVPVPATPTGTLVTPTGFTLNWPRVIGAVSYDVYKNGVFLINVANVGIGAQSTPITGLSTGGSYNFSVAAVASAAGVLPKVVSAQSPLFNIMLSPGVTVTPGLTTDTSVTVSWATIPGATDYWVYVNGQGWNYIGPGFTAGSGNLVAAGATQSTQLTGLLPNTTYALTLMWGTAAGNSSQSVATSVTTLPVAPAAPTATTTSSTVTLSGTAVTGAASYTFYDNGVAITGAIALVTPTVTLTTAAGSLHSYTMAYTTGALTSGQSMALSVLTPMLAPTAAAVTSSGLTLNWTAVTGATSYTVYQNGNALPAVVGTTLAITGLTAGTSYSYSVVATATMPATATTLAYTATSAKSAVLPVVTPMAAPVIGNATATSLTLNWSAVAGATGYTVYQNSVALPAVVGTATTRNITGLSAGVPYSYTVAYSTAAVPLSLQSAAVSVLPPPAPMAVPTAFAVSNSSVTLNWVPLAGVTPNYYVVYNNGVEIARPAVGVTSYAVTGLAASTSYNFTVAYSVNYGATPVTAAASPVLIVTTTAAPVAAPAVPAVPVTPTATLITTTGLTLNWTAVTGATGYTVYQALCPTAVTCPLSGGVALPAVAGTAVSRAIAGLTAGTTYTYFVVATNAGGASAQSTGLNVSTTAITVIGSGAAAPVPTAVPGAAGQLTLNWSAVAGATSYVVYQNGVMLPLVAGVVPSRAITGLMTGTSYNFRIAYRNALNVLSAPSAILTVKAP